MLTSLSILLFSFVSLYLFSYIFSISYLKTCFIFVWHTIFCFLAIYYTTTNVNDAISYYNWALNFDYDFRFGAMAVVHFNEIFIDNFNLSFVELTLIYNLIGCVGVFALASMISDITIDNTDYYFLGFFIIFIPSLHFWSSLIGKDTIIITSVLLFFWSISNLKKRYLTSFLSLIIIIIIRDYIFYLIAASVMVALILQLYLKKKYRLIILMTILMVFLLIIFSFLYNFNIYDFYLSFKNNINQYVEKRQNSFSSFDASIDSSNKTFIYLLFSYLFRPFIFDIKNIYSLVLFFENLIIFIIFILYIKKTLKIFNKNSSLLNQIIFFYFLLSVIVMSLITSNYGIALRQKWMFLPIFLYLIISVNSYPKNIKLK